MAEYIKFRLTAAKASVTLALLALVGGLPGAARAEKQGPSASAASSQLRHPIYLNYGGLPGDVQTVFKRLEVKLNGALETLNHKLVTSYYDKHKIDTTFLSINQANKEYYKEQKVDATFLSIEDANANFLKTADAANEFLKITDAGNEFLKITDANNEFLKTGGTAANSSELGGMTPDAFVQGHANVVSGMVGFNGDGKLHPLMQTVDGSVLIGLQQNVDNNLIIVVHNGTSSTLTMVADPTAVEYAAAPGQDAQIPAGLTINGNTGQGQPLMTHIQIFPGAQREVMTLTISTETVAGASAQTTAVGQMLIGLL